MVSKIAYIEVKLSSTRWWWWAQACGSGM